MYCPVHEEIEDNVMIIIMPKDNIKKTICLHCLNNVLNTKVFNENPTLTKGKKDEDSEY